jgi:hypothetical protein
VAPRIVAERIEGDRYRVTIEALAGAVVDAYVQAPGRAGVSSDDRGVTVSGAPSDFSSMDTPFARFGSRAQLVRVAMPASGGDADGYVRREVGFRR